MRVAFVTLFTLVYMGASSECFAQDFRNLPTLYPALHRLERAGLVESQWQDTPNNVHRRYYSITAKGRQALVDRLKEWQRFSHAMNSIMAPET